MTRSSPSAPLFTNTNTTTQLTNDVLTFSDVLVGRSSTMILKKGELLIRFFSSCAFLGWTEGGRRALTIKSKTTTRSYHRYYRTSEEATRYLCRGTCLLLVLYRMVRHSSLWSWWSFLGSIVSSMKKRQEVDNHHHQSSHRPSKCSQVQPFYVNSKMK